MKHLVVIRHARPEHQQNGEDDQARRLTKEGEADAFRLGRILAERGCIPDLILTSPARRAHDTTIQICRAMNLDDRIAKTIPELYSTAVNGILKILKSIPEKVETLFLIGHNPVLTHLVNSLCGPVGPVVPVVQNMSPGSAACIELKGALPEEENTPAGSLIFHLEP